ARDRVGAVPPGRRPAGERARLPRHPHPAPPDVPQPRGPGGLPGEPVGGRSDPLRPGLPRPAVAVGVPAREARSAALARGGGGAALHGRHRRCPVLPGTPRIRGHGDRGKLGLPVADRLPAAPSLREHAAHPDAHAAGAHHPRAVPGADVPLGASPVPSGAEPPSRAARAKARPRVRRSGCEAPGSALRERMAPRAEARKRLLEATIRTLATEGYAGTTARSIARTGGFAPGVIYYHFEDLEDLLLAALRHTGRQRMEAYQEALGSSDSGVELAERLRDLYEEDMAEEGHVAAVQELFAAAATAPRLREELLAHVERWEQVAAEAVRRLVAGTAVEDVVPARELGAVAVAAFL